MLLNKTNMFGNNVPYNDPIMTQLHLLRLIWCVTHSANGWWWKMIYGGVTRQFNWFERLLCWDVVCQWLLLLRSGVTMGRWTKISPVWWKFWLIMKSTQLDICWQLQMQLIFTWIYGLFLGGYQYSLKIYVFQKVLTNYHFIFVD